MSIPTLVLSLAAASTSAQDVCMTDITDPNSQLGQALGTNLSNMQIILKSFPQSVETCLASYQSDDAMRFMQQELSKCPKIINQIPEVVNKLANFNVDSSQSFTDMCQFWSTDVLTCLTTAVPALTNHLKEKSNGCCDEFFEDANTAFGKSVDDVIVSLTSKLSDVMCSVQTPGFNDNDSQTCAYTFYHAMKATEDPSHLLGMLQLTNTNACDAYNGKKFEAGVEVQEMILGKIEAGIVLGSCAVPVDNFMSELASFPYVQTDTLWSKLFAEDQVVTFMEILPSIQLVEAFITIDFSPVVNAVVSLNNSVPLMNTPVAFNLPTWFPNFSLLLPNLKLNIPSGFVDTCNFQSDIVLSSTSQNDSPPKCQTIRRN